MFDCWKLSKSYLGEYLNYSEFNYIELIKSKSSSIPLPALERKRKIFLPGHSFQYIIDPAMHGSIPPSANIYWELCGRQCLKPPILPLWGCDLSLRGSIGWRYELTRESSCEPFWATRGAQSLLGSSPPLMRCLHDAAIFPPLEMLAGRFWPERGEREPDVESCLLLMQLCEVQLLVL